MKWQDKGIVLSQRPCSENQIILNILTETHGRHSGITRVSKTTRQSASFQPGNLVEVTWTARLPEHLGQWTLEPVRMPWLQLINRPQPLLALSAICSLLDICLPERHPYVVLHEELKSFLERLPEKEDWGRYYALFELRLLSELGFGLNLSECAITKTTENLTYVSPKTGRAVCAEIGKPYAERLFLLSPFLIDRHQEATPKDLFRTLNMTGYFFNQFVLEGKKLPENRQRFVNLFNISP